MRRRVTSLVEAEPLILEGCVAACPEWTGLDLVRHLVGVAEDIASRRVDGWATPDWTGDQVAARAGASVGELLGRWEMAALQVDSTKSLYGSPAAMYAFGDAIVHEADLGEMCGPEYRPPDDDVEIAVRSGIQRWRSVLANAGTATLAIRVPTMRTWSLGQGPAEVTLETGGYELFRLLYGRRSRDEVMELAWSSAPAPYIAAGLPFPFRWADDTLVD